MEDSNALTPRRPTNILIYVQTCLEALVDHGLGDRIILGGAFGLLHYLDYRPTHHGRVWWDASATARQKQNVIDAIESALRPYGQVRRRTWGDVVSIELMRADRTIFSFRIAQRSVQLQTPDSAPWIDLALDSFPDLLASKMVALVERGAPRDFRDIYALCRAGLTTPQYCWELWRQRQELAGSDRETDRARLAIETHLTRIALHCPLERIRDAEQRSEAKQTRAWFREDFLNALMD
jgi:hypothetical protein